MAVLSILLGFFACAVTSLALGITAARVLRLDLRRAEAVCLGYAIGSAITSTFTLAIAALFLAWPAVFAVIALISLVLLSRQIDWLRRLAPVSAESVPLAMQLLFGAAWLAYGVLYFRQALSPEMSYDGMAYHLGLVNLWNHAHGLTHVFTIFGGLPDGVEMLYLFAFSIGRHSAATLIHFSFLMLLPVMVLLYGCRFGWHRGAAAFAGILVLASPLFGVDGTVAYNDIALAAVVFASIYLLDLWREKRDMGALVACGFLAGFAFAIKYTAGFLGVFVVATILWDLRHKPRMASRAALLAAFAIALAPAPYLVRNVIWFQNPVAFLGNEIFPNRWFHVAFEQKFRDYQAHLNGVTWTDLPRELTIGGPKIREAFGPAFVLLPLALAGVLWPRTRFLLLAAAFLALPFDANKSARFLIPAVPMVALAAGYVLCRWPRSSIPALALAVVHLVVSWPSINNQYHFSSGWRMVMHISWRTALRIQPEDDFLRGSSHYTNARMIEEKVPEGQPVLALGPPIAQAYTTRPILVSWQSAFAERMTDLIQQAANAPQFGRRVWTAALPQSQVRELRITQGGHGPTDAMWSVNEIRFWHEGVRVLPAAAWHLDARPNRWDLPLALDGLESTRWRSWETIRPGMWIDIRFDSPQAIDRIELVSDDSQWESQMAASVLAAQGGWRAASGSSWRVQPPLDLRQETGEQLKKAGIRYIQFDRRAWFAEPFRGDFAGWGFRQIGATPDSLLLQVD